MRRGDWVRRTWVKAAALLLAALMVPLLLLCSASLVEAYENNWWVGQSDLYEADPVWSAAWRQQSDLYNYLHYEQGDIDDAVWLTDATRTNYRFTLYDRAGGVLYSTLGEDDHPLRDMIGTLPDGRVLQGGVAGEMLAQDFIFWGMRLSDLLHRLHAAAPWLAAGAVTVFLACAVVLACGAGRRAGRDEAVAGWQERLPLDLYLCAAALWVAAMVYTTAELLQSAVPMLPFSFYVTGLCAFGAAVPVLGVWMTVCARVKLGKWWRCTVVYCTLRLVWRGLRGIMRLCGRALAAIPLVWKTALTGAAASVLLLYAATERWDGLLLVLLGLLFLTTCTISWQLRVLQKGARSLSAGDLEAKVDTRHLVGDFRRHGEDLNAISAGMSAAVERQLRSERLKTELITNVSHDIKTPLTSLINYVDLLQRDPGGPHTEEYLAVLERQSHKLKKLTEDLVEVSKASTGNLSVDAQRRSVTELLQQAVGEYRERLEKSGLTPVLTLPEQELLARMDGTLTWRVVDNLLSNACKYAQGGTRLYIDARQEGDSIRMSFKNISRDRLNLPAEELMERFVRGDSARGGEGSGLGLNIARSLTELQRGVFSLSVDGDLFRVDVTLPAAP